MSLYRLLIPKLFVIPCLSSEYSTLYEIRPYKKKVFMNIYSQTHPSVLPSTLAIYFSVLFKNDPLFLHHRNLCVNKPLTKTLNTGREAYFYQHNYRQFLTNNK